MSTCKKNANSEYEAPSKLIVATPEPTTKFGQWIYSTSPIINTFTALSLPVQFAKADDDQIKDNHCRLDISGDIHHYARYWGGGPGQGPKQSNYASVVAGGGGAFLHATHTDVGEITPNMLYPSRKDSHNEMIKQLLNPLNVWFGGYVWLAGAIIVLFLYFAATIPDSTWSILSSDDHAAFIPNMVRPCTEQACCNGDLLQRVQCSLSIESINTNNYSLHYFDFAFSLGLLAFLVYVIIQVRNNKTAISKASIQQWNWYRKRFLGFYVAFIGIKLLVTQLLNPVHPPYPAAASMLALLHLINAVAMLSYARLIADIMITRKKYLNISPDSKLKLSWKDENLPV